MPAADAGDACPGRALWCVLLRELQHAGRLGLAHLQAACGAPTGAVAALLPGVLLLPWPVATASRLAYDPFRGDARVHRLAAAMAHAARTGGVASQAEASSLADEGSPGVALLAAASLTLLAQQPLGGAQRAAAARVLPPIEGGGAAARLARQLLGGGGVPWLQPADDAPSVLLASLALHIAACAPPGPLRAYVEGAADLAADYVVAAPSRSYAFSFFCSVLVGGPFSLFTCACGYRYPVGGGGFGCLQTNGHMQCPNCPLILGNDPHAGMHNIHAPGQTRLGEIHERRQLEALFPELPGLAADPVGVLAWGGAEPAGADRGLPPATFRAMSCLAHAALAVGAGVAAAAAPATAGAAAPASPAAPLLARAAADLAALAALLPGLTPDGLGALMHRIVASALPGACDGRLRTPAARLGWERAFAAAVGPLVGVAAAAAADALAAFAPGDRAPPPLCDQLAEQGPGWEASWQRHLLRGTTPRRTLEDAAAALWSSASHAAESPLLCFLLRPGLEARARLAASLGPIAEWMNGFAAAAAAAKITRTQAMERDVASFLVEAPALAPVYARFAAAMADVAAHACALQLGCEAVPAIEVPRSSGRGVKLALFCAAPKGAGAALVAVASAVARHHNALLAELRSDVAPRCAALAHLAGTQPRAVRFAHLATSDLLTGLDAGAVAAALRDCTCAAETGRGVDTDWAAAERVLASPLADAAAVAAAEPGSEAEFAHAFVFAGETFRGSSDFLADLRARVPQAASLPGDDALRAALAAATEADVFDLLSSLEAAAFDAAARCAPPDQDLAAFEAQQPGLGGAARWLARLPGARPLQLAHLEAAYVIAEDAVLPGLFDAIDFEFKEQVLPADAAQRLRAMCGFPFADAAAAAGVAHTAAAASLALKRFAARYLAGEAHFDTPRAPLAAFLERVPWPSQPRGLRARAEEHLPDAEGLELRHLHAAVLELDALAAAARVAAARRVAPQAPTAPTTTPTSPAGLRGMPRRQRGI